MNRHCALSISCCIAIVVTSGVRAETPLGTGFSYQGKLELNGAPLNDSVDFELSLWDDAGSGAPPTGGSQIGSTVTLDNVTVTDGLFTAQLDFGAGAFDGDRRWLQIAVRSPAGGGAFTTLSPRQEVTPAPYALALPGLYTQQNATSPNVIGGFKGNEVTAGVVGGTISGGGDATNTNRVTDDYGTVGGGMKNQAGDAAGTTSDFTFATVAGGVNNQAGKWATVGGGASNTASGTSSTIGGGVSNEASGDRATVAGGLDNTAGDLNATVGGGSGNTASGQSSTVSGGSSNSASDNWATVGGGVNNEASQQATVGGGSGNTASSLYSTIAGGSSNSASGNYASIPGGLSNEAGGSFSFAAGRRAKVRDGAQAGNTFGDRGTFVWADATDADFTSTGDNQFLIRAGGGVGIGTTSPDAALQVVGAENDGVNAAVKIAAGTQVMLLDGNELDSLSAVGLYLNNNVPHPVVLANGGGHVSIGTTDTDARLLVRGAAGEDAFRVRVDTASKLVVKDNGGVAIGSNFGTVPPNGLRVEGSLVLGFDDNPIYKLEVGGNIRATGSVLASCGTLTCSDQRFKANIQPIAAALETVEKLRPVSFDWKREEYPNRQFTPRRQTGLIAQQVREVLPELVQQDGDSFLWIDYARITPLLIQAVKEQQQQIESLRTERNAAMAVLRAENEALTARLERIEKMLIKTPFSKEETK